MAHGGQNGPMAHQYLDGAEVLTGFQHMGSETVPKRMDAFSSCYLGFLLGRVIDSLSGPSVHRLVGISSGEQPNFSSTVAGGPPPANPRQ